MRKRNKKMANPVRFRRAQSTLEYAVLIVIVALALLATQVYIKRGYQGRLRSGADEMGEQFSAAGNITINTNSFSNTEETVQGRVTLSNLVAEAQTNKVETLNIGNADTEFPAPPAP